MDIISIGTFDADANLWTVHRSLKQDCAMESSTDDNKKERFGFNPAPREDWTLISQGAEARIWKLSADNHGSTDVIICKERFSKAYRHPDLDQRLTKSRCRSEAKTLEKCTQKSDIRVPKVVRVEAPLLYIEYLDGPTLKSYLNAPDDSKQMRMETVAQMMGIMIGRLHNLGVIHGDLTTSNVLVLPAVNATKGPELALIDFGLSKSTTSVEEQAVDLYVLERALLSTHPELPEDFFDKVLESYASIANKASEKKYQSTLQRLEQVRQRGRKRECFG
jgi:TP53 regulating kinase-like protein